MERVEFRYNTEHKVIVAVFIDHQRKLGEDLLQGGEAKARFNCETILLEIYVTEVKHRYAERESLYNMSTRCTRREQYQELLDELNSIGYDLLGLNIMNEQIL